MSEMGFSGLGSRVAALGIRGKVLGLAGLGLCALPCVIAVLIWRDGVMVAGLAPLLAIGCATLAAIATLIGLDLTLRPVSQTGLALRRLLGGGGTTDLPRSQPGPEGWLMHDAQRVIDELIALRAEQHAPEAPDRGRDQSRLAAAIAAGTDPAQAVVVVRLANGVASQPEQQGQSPAGQFVQETTRRLRAHYGADLTIAEVGQTDLAFVLPLAHVDLAATSDFSQGLQAVISDLGRPILSDDLHLTPVVLAGVAALSRGGRPDQSIEQAFAALDTAARATPLIIYNDDVRDRARDHHSMVQDLRNAVQNEEFELYFQPVMDISANRPVGAEALIRWHSPARGFVAPDKFIPMADASGLIDPIGLWVLREACRAAAGWDPSLRVSINLGARQFLDEDLPWHVSEAINHARIRPDQLEIELTESIAMVDNHHTRTTFAALRDMGVRIAIDDFGKGHANLNMLRKLPFTTLKIDREFVTDVHLTPGSQAICDALIALGAGLGLAVVAEGTELAEEVTFLSRRGCTMFQGYYFARPVPGHVLGTTFDNLSLRQAS